MYTSRKYKTILDDMLRSIEQRDGLMPQSVASLHKEAVEEGMCREGILQILASERFSRRVRFLWLYPELIVPYLCRIKPIRRPAT